MCRTFLIKYGLSRESFIATGVVIACMMDVVRISIYSLNLSFAGVSGNYLLLTLATISTFAGRRLIKKVTIQNIRLIVSIMLFGIAVGLGSGVI